MIDGLRRSRAGQSALLHRGREGEDHPDRADLCETTGRVLSRHTGYDANLTRTVLRACAAACTACGDERAQHADMHEHCRVCAEACRRCEQACRTLIASMG